MNALRLFALAPLAALFAAPAFAQAPKPPAPVTALAYAPDGKRLAAGLHGEVVLIDPLKGELAGKLGGQTGRVTALGYSRDGKWLAVASGDTGKVGEVRLYPVADGNPAPKPAHFWNAHKDTIHDLAFSPDGKLLATTGYDRLIKLWDVASAKEVRTLKDHSDSVYGLSFNRDGTLLASAAADRAVKVWEVATGTRLYTLGDPTDWVYAVAFSPDGKHLAAAGIDKSIRVWEANAEGGKLVHSVFAHEQPVTRLLYSPDGSLLYSVGEGRTIKVWDAARMVEKRVFPAQPDSVLSLALRPDGKQLAAGRYDGACVLLDAETGKPTAQPLPANAKPQLMKVTPAFGPRGRKLTLTFEGKDLAAVDAITASVPGLEAKILPEGRTATTLRAEVSFPAHTAPGVVQLALGSPGGASGNVPFTLDRYPAVFEKDVKGSASSGTKVTLPATLVGTIARAGEADFYRFEAKAGRQIGVQVVTAALGSKLDPVVELTDADGKVLAEGTSLLGFVCPKDGAYSLGVRDRDFRGAADMTYRIHAGDIPVVTGVFPLGVQRGTEASIRIEGVNLGGTDPRVVKVKVPADAALGSKVPVAVPHGANGETPLGESSVIAGEFPESSIATAADVTALPVPGTADGVIHAPGVTKTLSFAAKKGQRLLIEVQARRIGSPLDSYVEVLDAKGKPVMRATLRCVAKTFSTFRDNDSSGSGIRLETWNELAMDDYLYVGGELMRIFALPKNPDDDCQFYAVGGQRVGFLDTTPTHHAMGSPMYKVEIHPPGSTFPPNGMPLFQLPYRNDDGGAGYGKDSRLFFDPPADGEYRVRVGDSRGQGGPNFGFRLTVRPPRPDFSVALNPTAPSVWKGNGVPVTVTATRLDGFDGPIEVKLENLPPGFEAPPSFIEAGQTATTFTLFAAPNAAAPAKAAPLKLVARAKIDGKEVVREATGGPPKAVEPGDLVTATAQREVVIKPGQETRLVVTVERRNGFSGRVPLDVRGLPHGVRVLDIGLNGILILPGQTSREVAIYAEPWVKPMERPFVVLSRREGKGTEHAANSVLLKVRK